MGKLGRMPIYKSTSTQPPGITPPPVTPGIQPPGVQPPGGELPREGVQPYVPGTHTPTQFDVPEWEQSRVSALQQQFAAPQVGRLKRQASDWMAGGYDPQAIQARRATTRGYGEALGAITAGAGQAALSQYGQEYGAEMTGAKADWQAEEAKRRRDFEMVEAGKLRKWQTGQTELTGQQDILQTYMGGMKCGGKVLPFIKRAKGGPVKRGEPGWDESGEAVVEEPASWWDLPVAGGSDAEVEYDYDIGQHLTPGAATTVVGKPDQPAGEPTGGGGGAEPWESWGADWGGSKPQQQQDPWQKDFAYHQLDWSSSERTAGQTFQAEQAGITLEWTTAQKAIDRAWQTGEREGKQGWQSAQDEIQRLWMEAQTKAQQAFQAGESEKGRKFQAEQALLQREWIASREMTPWEMKGYATREEAMAGIKEKRETKKAIVSQIMAKLGYGQATPTPSAGTPAPAETPVNMPRETKAAPTQHLGKGTKQVGSAIFGLDQPVKRQHGGPVYSVGEGGTPSKPKPELVVYNGGRMELVGKRGPELRTFPEKGEVIPAGKTKKVINGLMRKSIGRK